MKNFDRFIGIDWSGAKSPVETKSIAVSLAERGKSAPKILEGPWSRVRVASFLADCVRANKRALVGIDCNFGYSEIVGERQFGKDYAARHLWAAVEGANIGAANFFAGGYWAHGKYGACFWREGAMPKGFSMPRRLTEQACGKNGLGWPESPFKLIGAKQVGKGGLAGMRLVHHLKQELGRCVAVWPFERDCDDAVLVITEIYPRLFLRMAGHGNRKIRTADALDTALVALESAPVGGKTPFSDHQADAVISAAGLRLLCGRGKTVPENIASPSVPRKTLEREGWIFGVEARI